jgi:hypothetical protein
MRYKVLGVLLFTSFFFVSGAYAQNTYYLPQIENGTYGGGSAKTTFVVFNNTGTPATATLNLTDDNGNPFVVTIGSVTDSSFPINLPPGATQILQTDGKGSLATGAAKVTSTSSIGVSAIFTLFDTNGSYVTETGVGSSDPQTDFVLPVDSTGFFNTGVGLFNNSGSSATVTMTLRDTTGAQAGSPLVLPSLANGAHKAGFFAGAGQFFPSITSFRGTLLVHSTAPIAAVVLRQYSSASKLGFTSLPVVPTSTTKTSLKLAQVVDGGGIVQTSFLIFNMSSSSTANVTMTLTGNDGSPLSVTIPGLGTHSTFSGISLGPGASIFLQTDGSLSSVTAGAATITSNVPIGASGIFTILSAGAFQTEAGVGDSPVLTSFTLPIDITGNFDTGAGFFNPSGSTAATLTFRVYDANGVQVGADLPQTVQPMNHLALYVDQLFPSLSNFRGSLAVTSTSPVAAVTLRVNNSPLSYTTLPVVSGTYAGSGSTGGSALLSKTETGITATSNVIKNEVLPSGFKLTGTVTGPGTATGVTAISGQSAFAGAYNSQTGKYLIVLPAGTYNLSVSFTPTGVPTGQTVSVTQSVSGSVQVSADTTDNITFTGVSLFNVSGTVNGLANLTTPTNLTMSFTSNGTVSASFTLAANGSYQGVLPAGNYTAGLTASISFPLPAIGQSQSLGIYNLGSAAISGNTVIPAFTVPATARLSGTIHGVAVPVTGVSVSATGPSSSITSSSNADIMTAQYQMILPKNITYGTGVTVDLIQGTSLLGILSFPISANNLNFTADTVSYDFTVPTLPVYVTVSGHVTDSSSNPVNNATIIAVSQSITGIGTPPGLQFETYAQTDASGNYSMSVLSGTNYQLMFYPPSPSQ